MAKPKQQPWRNRITGHGDEPLDGILQAGKVRLNFCVLCGGGITQERRKPFFWILVALLVVASIYAVAQWNDISLVGNASTAKWYPVIGADYNALSLGSPTNSATMTPIRKAIDPIGLSVIGIRELQRDFAGAVPLPDFSAVLFPVNLPLSGDSRSIVLNIYAVFFYPLGFGFSVIVAKPLIDFVSVFLPIHGGFLQYFLAVILVFPFSLFAFSIFVVVVIPALSLSNFFGICRAKCSLVISRYFTDAGFAVGMVSIAPKFIDGKFFNRLNNVTSVASFVFHTLIISDRVIKCK